MAGLLCHFLLRPFFYLPLPHRRDNCLPEVNQGRSEEISRDVMVWLQR